MVGDELKESQNSYGMNVYDLMNYHGLSTSAKLVEQVVGALQREIRKLKKDKADLCKMWGIDPGTKRRKAMQVRIVKEEHLLLDGKLSVHYVPEYKGWFFWNRFVEYDCDSCCTQASFETHEEAQAFLDNAVRMRGRDLTTVVAVGEAERTGKS